MAVVLAVAVVVVAEDDKEFPAEDPVVVLQDVVVEVPGDVLEEDLPCDFAEVDPLVAVVVAVFPTCRPAANAEVVEARGALAAVPVQLEDLRAYADPVPGAALEAFLGQDVDRAALNHLVQASEGRCNHRRDVLGGVALDQEEVHVDVLACAADEGQADRHPPLHGVVVVEADAAVVVAVAEDPRDGRASEDPAAVVVGVDDD